MLTLPRCRSGWKKSALSAPLAAIIGILVGSATIQNAKNTHQSTSEFVTLTYVLLALAVLVLVTSLLRKRLFQGITLALFGLAIFNLRFWGFGVPFLLAGAWYLVRAYRLQQALKQAEADLPALTSAVRLAGATPVARVRHPGTADIGRALDLGCEGVIVPNVDSAAQARQVAGAVRYPPAGHRSVGGVLAAAEPFCLVMAESADALDELDATLAVEGVDGLYVGPGDLSLSLGCVRDPDDPVLSQALQRVWAACSAAGKPVGVHATDGVTARRYRDAGCTLITIADDSGAITRHTAAEFGLARA